jgi:CRP/FNR family transcriptional regulator, cyclic AMP receptor protein
MTTGPNFAARFDRLDPLEFLPCSTVVEYRKQQVIYGYNERCDSIYVVLSGFITVHAVASYGNQFLVDFYSKDDLFGDLGLIGQASNMHQAVAFQKATVMRWQTEAVQEIILNRPKLAIALLQTFGKRALAMTTRLEQLSFEPIINRLVIALLRFSNRTGVTQPDGTVRMDPLTHEMLAQYVGTSRELVTCHMLELRRRGLIQYSRKMIVFHRETLENWLQSGPSKRQESHIAPDASVRAFTAST